MSGDEAAPADEPDYTRRASLEDVIKHLQNHAHLCIDGQDFEPAQMITAAAQLIVEALGKLAETGVDENPYTESAHTRAGG